MLLLLLLLLLLLAAVPEDGTNGLYSVSSLVDGVGVVEGEEEEEEEGPIVKSS